MSRAAAHPGFALRPGIKVSTALLFAPLLLLAACGGNEDIANSASAEKAEDAAIAGAVATGAGSELVGTSNLPDFVQIYDGATVVMNITSSEGDNRGGIFAYTVNAPFADVIAFTRATFDKAGIAIDTELTAPGGLSLGGQDKASDRTLFATITPGEDGAPTSVNISYSRPAD